MTNESRNQFIDKLILSIRTENIDAFDENTQKGIIWFGEKDVAKILNEELPLLLNSYDVANLLRFMVHNDQTEYKDVVLNLLAEVIKQLEKENLKFNKDYHFTNNIDKFGKEGEPVILIKEVYAEKIKSMYTDFAWSQLSPYVLFCQEEN